MKHMAIIATLGVLLLAACGKESSPPSPSPATKPAETAPSAPAPAAPAAPTTSTAPAAPAATDTAQQAAAPGQTPSGAAVSGPLDDKKAQEIMARAGCAACHAANQKIVGPAYKDVAAKRKTEKDAVPLLMKKVREGGSGVYGPIPMPPNPKEKISDEELKAMVEWVLTK